MNIRDSSYARYITIGVVACLIALAAIWIYKLMPREQAVNTDPRKGRVCFDSSCFVSKQCDADTLRITTTIPGQTSPTVQKIANSAECK